MNCLENYNQFKDEIDHSFESLKKLIGSSFEFMESHPGKKDEVVDLWKDHIVQFISVTFKTSEKYNNREVFKAITKALMFGKG